MRAAELPLANDQRKKGIRSSAKKGLRGTKGPFGSVKMRAAELPLANDQRQKGIRSFRWNMTDGQ